MPARPYRVVFSYASSARPGTIVAADLDTARREAQRVAEDGGTAVVQYATATGDRELIAIYTP